MSKLNRKQDAFGRAMWDCHCRGQATMVLERDDGLVEPMPIRMYAAAYEAWSPRTRELIDRARGRVLDIGCGLGRHGLHLQQRGLDVLGIDTSPLALRAAKARGLKHVRLLSLTQITRRLGMFDTVLLFGNGIALLGNPRRARWLLRRLRSVTNDHARIIGDARDPYQTDDPEHLAYHRANRRRGRMAGQLRFRARYRTAATPWIDLLLLSADELHDIAASAGWRMTAYPEGDGADYGVVLEKEARP